MENQIKVGVSSCLLGEKVRFDGGHKQNTFIVDKLANYFTFESFCPEVAIGLGVPRQTIRLVKHEDYVRAVGTKNYDLDVTEQLISSAHSKEEWHKTLSGYIVKKDSPSCGMERVRVYNEKNMPDKQGTGLYTQVLLDKFPSLPIEEEGRMSDPVLRENFVQRVFVYHRWQTIANDIMLNWSSITEFHAQHKYLLMSHNQQEAKQLGQWLANSHKEDITLVGEEYISRVMAILKQIASRKNHANTLSHIQGYLKTSISPEDKQELLTTIMEYKEGLIPLVVPVRLLQHHFAHHPNDYIKSSFYLAPHPKELMLLNHI